MPHPYSAADDNPFLVDGEPQWAEIVDYLRSRALTCEGDEKDYLCAIADVVESHAGDGGAPELVRIGTLPNRL